MAVESANPGRLNAFAVFVFCPEMTRLPAPPAYVTPFTTPSRSTTVAHIPFARPPLTPESPTATTASKAAMSSAWLGSADVAPSLGRGGNVGHVVPVACFA